MAIDGQNVNSGETDCSTVQPTPRYSSLACVEALLTKYIIDEVQRSYRLVGVKINDKHILK